MKKNILLLIVGIILVSIFTGCSSGSYISIGSFEKNTSSSMYMSYSKLNGQKSISLKVKKGEVVDVDIDIVTKDGSISLSIFNEEGKSFYKGTDVATSSFVVSLEKEGDYKLTVDAKNHKGSYKVLWNIREQKEVN